MVEGGLVMSKGRWLSRVLRGLRPDRNPLRRTCDRVETYLLMALLAASAAVAPFAAQAASHAAYAAALHTQRVQQASEHQVRAELTPLATGTDTGYSLTGYVPVRATWTSVTGVRHTREVMAPAGTRKGSTVTIWADAAGNVVSPPLLTSQVAGQGQLGAVGGIAGIGALYLCAAVVVRRVLNRRRLAAWDADWRLTGPAWNRQSW
jgi:hypothetical protein